MVRRDFGGLLSKAKPGGKRSKKDFPSFHDKKRGGPHFGMKLEPHIVGKSGKSHGTSYPSIKGKRGKGRQFPKIISK